MTLGQKLSAYRKVAGMTQQQLGEHLNISAQAVSKWENDQAEPDLATIRSLADIYKVSVDTLLNGESVPVEVAAEAQEEEAKHSVVMPIGYCKNCGIAVTEENLGEKTPVIICKNCKEAKELAAKKAAEAQKKVEDQKKQEAKRAQFANRAAIKRRLAWSMVIASLVALVVLIIGITGLAEKFEFGSFFIMLVFTYAVFSFVNCLFYDCWVQDTTFDWFTKGFNAPGLIFSFDLDGCLWLIGMKLLFWLIGVVIGLISGIIGIIVGLVSSPFVFPFVMRKLKRDYNAGVKSELLD